MLWTLGSVLASCGPSEPRGGCSGLGQAGSQEMTVASGRRWLTAGGGWLVCGCRSSCPQCLPSPHCSHGLRSGNHLFNQCTSHFVTSRTASAECKLQSCGGRWFEIFQQLFPKKLSCSCSKGQESSCWIGSKETFPLKVSPRSVEVMLGYEQLSENASDCILQDPATTL